MATMLNDVMRTAKSGMSSARETTASTLQDVLSAAKEGLESAKDVGDDVLEKAKDGVDTIKEGGEHTFASVSWGVAKGLTALAGVATALRKFDTDQGLSWIGLTRKRSPLVTIALVTSGVVVGAGIGMLLAPMAGAELRQRILGGSKELPDKASTVSFVRPEEQSRITYDMVKSGQFEKALQGAATAVGPDVSKLGKLIDKDKLPDFSIFAKYLSQGGGYGVTDDDGITWTSFSLRRSNP